ncbi:MAG: hypothetical protein IJT77_03490 [Clostridia bacterium]|nr:hypothetical protein [Clostridia bacterium]
MRAVYEQARLDQIDQELMTAHAEITVRLDSGDSVYVQAHDNGLGRYFVLSRVSYFQPSQVEEDDDVLEEYSTGTEKTQDRANLDFIEFLDTWNAQHEEMDEAPYIGSTFSPFFQMGENMLDLMLADMEEEEQLG